MIAVIDCGTTNTKIFITDKCKIIAEEYFALGTKDVGLKMSNMDLKKNIKKSLLNILSNNSLNINELEKVVAFGMITSEIGLINLPHIEAPVGKEQLKNNLKVVYDDEIIEKIPIIYIPGIKNNTENIETNISNLNYSDFMRGEETQCIGILKIYNPTPPVNIIVLSSHTKLIRINENYEIEQSLTALSGQLYNALIENTFIGKSLKDNGDKSKYSQYEIINFAKDVVAKTGFTRALLMPRIMEVLGNTSWQDRKCYLTSIIINEDLKILDAYDKESCKKDYFIIGDEERANIFEIMLKDKLNKEVNVVKITTQKELRDINIVGTTEITENYKIK